MGTERGGVREDAGAAVPHQQVNLRTPRYPIDRYLVERSNKFEMVNIIDDDIWNAQPALRPEDEIILRKLHDMLRSTADDLKLLSGELSKHREPGVQVKSLPTPLDEEFNEKIHIEEIVNAKFHGYNIVDNSSQPTPANTQRDVIEGLIKSIAKDTPKHKKVISTGVQVSQVPITKKSTRKNNLALSRTKIIQIDENFTKTTNGGTEYIKKEKNNKAAVTYIECSFRHAEDKKEESSLRKPLQIQNMPSISIRSELKEQKVFNLDIEPEVTTSAENVPGKNNISVISVQHKTTNVQNTVPKTNHNEVQFTMVPTATSSKDPIRKVSKMSSCESSESNNNINSKEHSYRQTKPNRVAKRIIGIQSKESAENIKYKKNISNKKEYGKHSSLNEWKKKLNAVYGRPVSSRRTKTPRPELRARNNEVKPCSSKDSQPTKNTNMLNNAEYIPYSKLTIGGVRVSDIEREISDIPNKNDIALSPILDKILSRENSFHHESPRVDIDEASSKILTTSDENLLREVIEIEKKVNNSLNINITRTVDKTEDLLNDIIDQDSYVDDFEDEKSELSEQTEKQNRSSDLHSEEIKSIKSSDDEVKISLHSKKENDNQKKRVIKKTLNLSFKNKVDVFEYLHSVDTQETGTQSNSNKKISLKETQTSPRNDSSNVQPIYNDLWPSSSIDPKGEVEKLFELEKDFIKKLIIDEYGDILAKNLNKPSTSKDHQTRDEKNVVATQKNTQTSPSHVKSVMTSPTRTKTRTTSPFAVSLTVDKQTSPVMIEEVKIDVADDDDLGISINLSSPRFSLRLPQSSREVISNLESHMQSRKGNQTTSKSIDRKSNRNNFNSNARTSRTVRKQIVSSTSSVDGDYSSSDISSLGEIRFSLKKKLRKLKIPSISELSSSTSHSKSSSDISDIIAPQRSEGEVSLGQVNRRNPNKNNKSEGELSLGRVY